MANRAKCGDCGETVLATSATPIVRASGVVLVCASCRGAKPSKPTAAAKKQTNPLLSAPITTSKIVRRTPRAHRAPIPEAVALASQVETDAQVDDDYDAIYVSIEAEEPSDVYPTFGADETTDVFAKHEATHEIEAEPPDGLDAGNSSAGLDYASTSGAIEVTSQNGNRDDSTPPPAVVISD